MQEVRAKRKELSKKLLKLLDEFHKLGMTRNYTKVVENQVAVINTHLEGTVGQEAQDLRKTKEELEEKLQLVKTTSLNEPFASRDPKWAHEILELDQVENGSLTREMVLKAFRNLSKTEHPDKGGNTERFQRIERAKEILLECLEASDETKSLEASSARGFVTN